jgi:hypothetical protein
MPKQIKFKTISFLFEFYKIHFLDFLSKLKYRLDEWRLEARTLSFGIALYIWDYSLILQPSNRFEQLENIVLIIKTPNG